MMTEAQVRERMERLRRGEVTMGAVYLAEAERKDSEARKRVLARMTETGSREAMLALHSTLADQMPDMTAEGGYWYALGYLEGALGLHRMEEGA